MCLALVSIRVLPRPARSHQHQHQEFHSLVLLIVHSKQAQLLWSATTLELQFVGLCFCFCAFSFFCFSAKERLMYYYSDLELRRASFLGLALAQYRLVASWSIVWVTASILILSRLSHSFEVCVSPDLNCTALTLVECIFVSKQRVQLRLHTSLSELC